MNNNLNYANIIAWTFVIVLTALAFGPAWALAPAGFLLVATVFGR